MLTLNDGRSELWQWDTGRKLTVDADCSQVHFSNKVFGRSIDVDVIDGVATIPDILLQTDKELTAWAFVGTPENGYTKISKVFKVNRRSKPADYVFTPPEQTSLEEIKEKIEYLESIQDPDAIKNAVEDYLEKNPVEAPVQSVNGKTGKVELTAEDVGAISQDDLQEATNKALEQAKESGMFDGRDGDDYVLTEADKAEIAEMAAELVEVPDSGGNVDPEQIANAVKAWLDKHPEATTTVKWGKIMDGEIFELSTEEEPSEPVPCTGITLDKTELALSDTETAVTLVATVTPFDTTDQIVWSVNKTGVVTVENGVVKGIANGSCVITAKCGAYSATCSVTVEIIASYTKAGLLGYYDFADYADDYAGEITNKHPETNSSMFAAVRVQNRHATKATQLGIKSGVLRVGGEEFRANGADAYMQIYHSENRVFVSTYPYTIEFYSKVRGGFSDGVEQAIGYGTTWAMSGKAGLVSTRTPISDEASASSRIFVKRGTDVFFNSNMRTLRTAGSAGEGANEFTLPDTYVIDEYHHYVVIVDSALVRVYIDGVLVGEGTASNNVLSDTETSCSFLFNADIKMVRVYNAILTDEQVANNYSNTIGVYGGEA